MIVPLLAALLLAAPASAQVRACQSNDMTAAWETVSLGLWLSDYTVPDEASRVATLTYAGCSVSAKGEEVRLFSGADGRYAVSAVTDAGGANGATTLRLGRDGAQVVLGTWGHHKVFYRGVGIDRVAVPGGRGTKNVFVIPVDPAKP